VTPATTDVQTGVLCQLAICGKAWHKWQVDTKGDSLRGFSGTYQVR